MKKLDFGEGGFQGFLTRHVEKGVLGCTVLVAMYLLYSGYGIESYDKDPEDLQTLASGAKQNILEDSWERVAGAEDRTVEANYEQEERLGSLFTQPHLYSFAKSLSPPLTKPIVKRGDPEIYAATGLQVAPLIIPLEIKNERHLTDPLMELKWQGATKVRRRSSRRNDRDEGSGAGDFGGGGDEGGPEGMEGFSGAASGADGDSKVWRRRGPYAPGRGINRANTDDDAPNSLPKTVQVVVITGLVPYEKQFNEFKSKFENAIAYEPRRDRPHYLSLVVERTEVIEGEDPDWKVIGSARQALQQMEMCACPLTGAPEVADSQHILFGTTTMPIPPFLMRNYENATSHPPEIPFRGQKVDAEEDSADDPGDASSDPDGDIPDQIPSGVRSGGADGLGGRGGGLGGLGGLGGDSGEGEGMGDGMGDGMGEGMGGMSGLMGSTAESVITEYKLVRFFDFSARLGHKYRYRVQLILEDPNNPQDTQLDVDLRMLETEAAERISALRGADKVKDSIRSTNYFRRTEFSEPSDVVWLTHAVRFFAGPADKMMIASSLAKAEVFTRPPKGKLAGVKTDLALNVDVPIDISLSPGDVLAVTGDLDFVHPISLDVRTLDKYEFRGQAVLVDMFGGYKVGGPTKEPLYSPGEYALISPDGELVVRAEKTDINDYRFYAFVEDKASGSGMGGLGGLGGFGGEDRGGGFGDDNDE
jgi:hypothetical protein